MDEKKPREGASKEKEKEREGGKKPSTPPDQQAPQPAKSNKMFLIGIVAGIVVLELVLGFVFVKMTAPKNPDELDAKMHNDSLSKLEEETTTMGSTTAEAPIEVLVNIAGTEGEQFLKAAIVLEYEDKSPKKSGGEGKGASPLGEAIIQRMPKYKSYLIENLSKMTKAEITAPETKEKIRKDLLRMVNGTLPPKLGEVRDIYFTQFIIQ
jgi:flagellar basal body-associated protein FliL